MFTPSGNVPALHCEGVFKSADAVLAFPFNPAVIVPAEKLPLESRATGVDGVLVDTAPVCATDAVPPISLNCA